MIFHGSMVALVTPFKDGKLDETALRGLIQFQIENGTDVIVPCGTTGESATLSFAEHEQVIDIALNEAGRRVPIVAGTGSNNTKEAILLSRHAEKAGVAACLLITPYYNKPTQDGLYLHFKKIAESVSIPLLLYNVPGRTAVNLQPETIARLAEIPNIVGIKEASGSLPQVSEIINYCGDDFHVISGDDINTLPMMAVGGKGVISVTANIAPREVASMVHAWEQGKFEEAKSLHHNLLALHRAMFLQTNPIPVKTALGLMGKITPELRLPLSPLPEGMVEKLQDVLKKYRLI